MGLFRRPSWSPVADGPTGVARVRHGRATVVVCGDRLDGPARAALASSAGTAVGTAIGRAARPVSGEPETGTPAQVVVIEQLCAHPEQLGTFYEKYRPQALVVAACALGASRAAADEAVGAGADAGRVLARSLAAALRRSGPQRALVVAASCRAWSCRARVLAGAPLAGHRPWRSGEQLDRRSLLGAWRGQPSTSARVDQKLCAGADRCGRCIQDCPSGAITVTGGVPEVDPLECVSCGRCVTTCPSYAVSMPGADLDGLAAELEGLLSEGLRDISVACERGGMDRERANGHPMGKGAAGKGAAGEGATMAEHASPGVEAEMFVPCAAMLGPGVLMSLSGAGVQVDAVTCADCPSRGVVDATARFAEQLAVALGTVGPDAAREPRGPTPSLLMWHEPEATNDVVARASRANKSLSGGDRGGGVILGPGAATFVVGVDGELCSVCGACALACPTSAISYDPGDQALEVDSSRCVGCRRCVSVCPESAICVERGIDMDAVLTGPSSFRAAPHAQACLQCGESTSSDPLVAAVQRRLAARGRPAALVASLSSRAAQGPSPLGGSDGGVYARW